MAQRVCLVSGGTGGHLMPALVLARALLLRGHEPLLVTEGREVERELLRRELPDVPAMRETMPELATYDVNTWFGLFGPAALPTEVVNSLNAEVMALLALPDTQRRFAELGGVGMPGNADAFAAFVRSEITKWAEVIRKEGLQLDAN